MNNVAPNLSDEIICPCSGTTRGKIQTLFEEGLDIDAISRRTGAVSGCSGCESDIIEMLICLSDHHGASLDQK